MVRIMFYAFAVIVNLYFAFFQDKEMGLAVLNGFSAGVCVVGLLDAIKAYIDGLIEEGSQQ